MKYLLDSALQASFTTGLWSSRIENSQSPLIVLTAAADEAPHPPGFFCSNFFALPFAALDRTLLRGRFISPASL